MTNWWEYYKLQKEPLLSPDPLTRKEDQALFFGREYDQQILSTITQGQSTGAVLITGNPGVGKTTLIHKLFMDNGGFIWVNLSNVQRFFDADIEIAESCIFTVKNFSKSFAAELRKRLLSTTSRTTGRNIQAGIAPGGIGGHITSVFQESMAPIRNIEVRDVIRESLEYLKSKKQRIYLFLDESDFFNGEYADQLPHLCKRIKNLLPNGSVLILANRDIKARFRDAFHRSHSLVRSTFRHCHSLDSLWVEGKGDIPAFLELRMGRGKPLHDYRFPFSHNACKVIDILSMGNFKLLLQYIEMSLMHGSLQKERLPLTAPFVKKLICDHFRESTIRDEDEETVLKYLAQNPTHVNDKNFTNIVGSRTNLQDVLLRLEDRRLVKRSTRRTGIKQVFSVTQKGLLLLKK
jgi:hypothetical protein